jgi:hypothetical protein
VEEWEWFRGKHQMWFHWCCWHGKIGGLTKMVLHVLLLGPKMVETKNKQTRSYSHCIIPGNSGPITIEVIFQTPVVIYVGPLFSHVSFQYINLVSCYTHFQGLEVFFRWLRTFITQNCHLSPMSKGSFSPSFTINCL